MQVRAEIKSHYNSDRWISLVVCFQVFLVGVKNMLIQAFEVLYDNNAILNTVLFVLVGALYIVAYFTLGKRMTVFSPHTLVMVSFVLLTFACSAMIHPEGIDRYGEILIYFLPFCFLTAFMLTRLTTLRWVAYYMERFAYVIVLVSLICVVAIIAIGHTTTSDWSTYSMSLSNVIMLGVMWLLYRYFERRKLSALIGAGLGLVAIVLCGSRNPLLAIAAYVVVKVIEKTFSSKTPMKERWLYLIWMSLIVGAVLFWRSLVNWVYSIVSHLGIYSRTVGLLMNNAMSDSGRSVIHHRIIEGLRESPLLGLGIGGDFVAADDTSHSLYWSVFSTFGYLVGTLLLLGLAILLYKAYQKSNALEREVLVLYACIILPRSFTGIELWRNDALWWLFGIMMVILSRNRTEGADRVDLQSEESKQDCPESEPASPPAAEPEPLVTESEVNNA